MSNPEYDRNTAPDDLQLNMDIISKELNDLIVNCEQEYGFTQQFQMGAVKTTQPLMTMTAPAAPNYFQVPTYITNAFYDQQQHKGGRALQNINHNLNYTAFQQPLPFGGVNNTPNYFAGTLNIMNPPNYCAGKYLNHSYRKSNESLYSNAADTPAYEFHYLRPHGENERKFTASASSFGGRGAFRKITKQPQKHFNQKMQTASACNEEIKVDLSLIDFFNIDKENFAVSRLFDLLRDLHCAVAETAPSFEENSDSQYEEAFAPSVTRKSTMPSTLNVQNQVKQACRMLTIFTHEMLRTISANKMFDAGMHAECEFYLNQLREYLNQLEMYKRIVMEHKNGQFLREEVKVHAERLSLLLEHTNRQIREVHIRILAADWYNGVKYRGNVYVSAMQFNRDNNKEISKKSKIGVINEILQMCNTTATTSMKTNTVPTASIAKTTKAPQIEIAKPETTINSPTKLINDQEMLNAKSLLNNNNIFNVYKPNQTKRIANIATSSHNRHPVFYIG